MHCVLFYGACVLSQKGERMRRILLAGKAVTIT